MKKAITFSIALAAASVLFSCKSHQGCPGVGTSKQGKSSIIKTTEQSSAVKVS
ncbi:MAG: hypothetical protein IAF38_02325 [Bacteroidia bacterium]|nr:hypothetical protein [Bacteroidia bacterium]